MADEPSPTPLSGGPITMSEVDVSVVCPSRPGAGSVLVLPETSAGTMQIQNEDGTMVSLGPKESMLVEDSPKPEDAGTSSVFRYCTNPSGHALSRPPGAFEANCIYCWLADSQKYQTESVAVVAGDEAARGEVEFLPTMAIVSFDEREI